MRTVDASAYSTDQQSLQLAQSLILQISSNLNCICFAVKGLVRGRPHRANGQSARDQERPSAHLQQQALTGGHQPLEAVGIATIGIRVVLLGQLLVGVVDRLTGQLSLRR